MRLAAARACSTSGASLLTIPRGRRCCHLLLSPEPCLHSRRPRTERRAPSKRYKLLLHAWLVRYRVALCVVVQLCFPVPSWPSVMFGILHRTTLTCCYAVHAIDQRQPIGQ